MRLGALPGRAVAKARRDAAARAGGRSGRGVVLLYHRVADAPGDAWGLSVSPARFEAHMDLLRSEFHPMTLVDLTEAARRRRVPEGAVAVTFDDGYADNVTTALPTLERYGVPAIVFVATAYMGAGRPFWWDELEAIFLDADGGGTLAERSAEHEDANHRVRRLRPREVERAMENYREAAGLASPAGTGDKRPMTMEELERLVASPLTDLGAHSRHHSNLAAIPAADVRAEVDGSRRDIAEWAGAPPPAFSYPFGQHGPRARQIVRRAGFDLGTGTNPAAVTWLNDRYELGRLWVEDEGPEWLELRMRGLAA
jgi:peptidoglycan/xylan/chitin deacetylase (PgdA/CDA1 family)